MLTTLIVLLLVLALLDLHRWTGARKDRTEIAGTQLEYQALTKKGHQGR
jgi:hypothetical protein